MLVCVACTNVWALTKNRPYIQEVFGELHVMYPNPKDNRYRTQHYQDVALFTMKYQYILYTIFYLYYNGAPLLLLLWEYLMDRQNMSYRTQTNMWFPWKVKGSAIGFGLAISVQALASVVGVAYSLKSLNIVCIFTYQLKLHCDALASQLLRLDSRLPGSYQELRILITYHCRIFDIGEQVNQILNSYFLSSLIFSTIAICMTSVAVVNAKAGRGSATLSMAYAGAHFVDSMLRGIEGQEGVVECAFVASELTDAPFFASPLELGNDGIKRYLPLPQMSDSEKEALEKLLPVLRQNSEEGIQFAKNYLKEKSVSPIPAALP